MCGPSARRIITLLLIGTLVPVPGLSWPAPARRRSRVADLLADRIFLEALNSTEQMAMSGPGRPQLYIVFRVNLPVPPSGPSILNADAFPWFNDLLSELAKQPVTTGSPAVAAPPESIVDEIAAGDAHVQSMTSAKRLASMPDRLPYEANPNESVSASRTIGVAIEDALQQAGFENDGNRRVDKNTGAVIYEGQTADGDISITGRLVNGQIELTKEFGPLTGSGDVGEPIRIRGTTATNASSTMNTSATPSEASGAAIATPPPAPAGAAGGSVALPPGGRPIPADAVRQWGQELYSEFAQQAQQVTGPRDGQGRLLDVNGQAIAPGIVTGLKLVQNAVVTDLQTFTEHLQELQNLPRDHKVALGKDLEDAARELRAAAAELDRARAAFEPFLASEQLYNNSMTRAAQLEQAGDSAGAAAMVTQAEATPYGRYVAARTRYVQLLNANPLLGVKRDGTFLYEAFADGTLFPTTGAATQTAIASDQRYVDLLNGYLAAGVEQTKQQAAELGAYNSIQQLAVFASPAYAYVHDRISAMGTMIGSTLTADMMNELRGASQGALKSWTDVAWQRIVDRSLIVLQIGCMFLPGGPLLALALAGAQIARAGKDTVVAYVDQQNAQQRAAATGFDQVIQTSDDLNNASKNLLWTGGLSLFDVYGAARYARLMRAMRAERQALNAGRNVPAAPTPSGAPPNRTPTRTSKPGDPADRGTWDPGAKPLDEADAVRRANANQNAIDKETAVAEVEAEIRLAREAGVPDEVIDDLTKGYSKDGLPLNNRSIADSLMEQRLQRQGFDITMTAEEYRRLQQLSVRSGPNGSGLTPDDMAFLRDQLARDPAYFDKLPHRGYLTGNARDPWYGRSQPQEGFIPGLSEEAAGNLRDAFAKNGGTIPTGTPSVAGAADNTGTVMLPPGAATADTTGTVILPPGSLPKAGTPTVQLGPGATAPTVQLGPGATAPTVQLGPGATAPTVRLGPGATAPTVRLGPETTAPTVRLDPSSTSRMTDEVMQTLPKVRQSGMTPQQAANSIRDMMSKSGVGPQQLVNSLRQRLAPRPVSMSGLGNPATAAARTGLDVSLEATGMSSGNAFTVKAANAGRAPVQLQGEGIVVEPVRAMPVRERASPSRAGTAANLPAELQTVTQPVEAFCLERVRPVAAPGTEYRVAPPAVQAQHRRLVDVLHAAQRVMDMGGLRPDSEIKGYFTFIRQWSIWTRQEKFDQKQFTEEFLNQTKKNVESQGVKWTNQMRDTVVKVAPGRWRDIMTVLGEVANLKASAGGLLPAALLASALPHQPVTPSYRRFEWLQITMSVA